MRRQPHPVIGLSEGLDASMQPSLLTDLKSPSLKEVYFHKGILKKDFGFSVFASTLAERPMLLYTYIQSTGTRILIAVTVDKAYQYNTTTEVWDLIADSTVFTGDEDDRFNACTMNDLFIVTNGKDAIQKWTGAAWAVLGGLTLIKADLAVPFYTYLLLLNTLEDGTRCPFRVRWSDTADPETWSGGNSGFFDMSDTQDVIIGWGMIHDRLYIFKDSSIWEVYYVGGSDIFKYRNVIKGTGTRSAGSIVNIEEILIFLGDDNFYKFDGAHTTPIGNEVVPIVCQAEGKEVNSKMLHRVSSTYSVITRDYKIALPTISNEPELILKYDLKTGVWTRRNKQYTTCFGLDYASDRTAWGAATGTWGGGDWDKAWDFQSIPPETPLVLYGLSTGVFHKDDRVTKSTETLVWESKDFVFGQASRITGFHISAKGDDFEMSHSFDAGLTWSINVILSPDSLEFTDLFYPMNDTTVQVRVRLRTSNENLEVRWVIPWFVKRKRSKEAY